MAFSSVHVMEITDKVCVFQNIHRGNMSSSTELKATGTEYTCVLKLAGNYAAWHVQGTKKKCISQTLEPERKTAAIAAQLFAKEKSISYEPCLTSLDKPIITIFKHEEKWFPAELHTDKSCLLMDFTDSRTGKTISLGRIDQAAAIMLASLLAEKRNTYSIPSIGISALNRPLV